MLSREPRLVCRRASWAGSLLGAWVALSSVALVADAPAKQRTQALAPAEALATLRVEEGLRVELVAAEPLVVSPAAFAFDERGRLYVVENRGYPGPIKGTEAPQVGRVARLEDTDGDGKFDRRTEFATGLGFPNGIAVWRGGVFVTCG